jgi:hypothetical protein
MNIPITAQIRAGQIRKDVVLQDPDGRRYRVRTRVLDVVFLTLLDPHDAFGTTSIAWRTLIHDPWYIVSGKEVRTMDEKAPTKAPKGWRSTPPRLTGQDRRARGKASVTFTTEELHQLATLLKVGKAITRETRSVSKNLRSTMTLMGVDATGL